MKLKKHYTTILLALCAALAACSDAVMPQSSTPNEELTSEKTPIELTVGGVEGAATAETRAVVTTGGDKILQNMQSGTSVFMLIKSEYNALTGDYAWLDYGGAQTTKYTTTRGDVGTDGKISFSDDGTTRSRFWDDVHARSSKLSIWALACDGLNYLGGIGTNLDETSNIFYNQSSWSSEKASSNVASNVPWRTDGIYANLLDWNVPHYTNSQKGGHTATTIKDRDLLFSNNVTKYVKESETTDKRTSFDTATKKFGESQLYFYHALSKISINIKKDDSFTDDEFKFKSDTENIQLNYFNIWGKFNAEDGEFKAVNSSHESINYIYNKDTKTDDSNFYELEALVLPYSDTDKKTPIKGSQLTSTCTDYMMEINIANNVYKITSKQLFDAIKAVSTNGINNEATEINLEAGKNYIFTFTIGKKKIDKITAQVADWETVTAEEQAPSNARIKLQLEERGEAKTSDVAFFKANDNKSTEGVDDDWVSYNWKTGYANLNASYSSDHWTTNEFWQSNKDFYHFRALMPDEITVNTDAENGDNVTLTSAASYTDIRWGAPMKDDGDNETAGSFKWIYDPETNGFDNTDHTQIYKAIGPTENPVKLILFHMMSDLTFNIKTTDTEDKVELCHDNGEGQEPRYTRTRVDLVGFYNNGKVLLGSGLVKTDGSASTESSPVNVLFSSATDYTQYVQQVYKFGAVPQDLTDVKLYITTPDNNQYIVDLKDVKALSSNISSNNIANPYTQNGGKYIINRWYPGFKYNYTFKLTKKGIDSIQATVVAWEDVEADEEKVQIK